MKRLLSTLKSCRSLLPKSRKKLHRFEPIHLLKVLLDDGKGMAANLINAARFRRTQLAG
ncbi:MAG: Clp protease N-terminal domain-containing protein [Alphaproteobacteria bacterium]